MELQSSYIKLLIPCPNARHGVGFTLDKYIPNASYNSEAFLKMYEFLGKLMGVAVRTGMALSLDLPSIVWKPLVGVLVTEGDVLAIDELCMKAMSALLDDKALAEKNVNEQNFQDTYGFTFTYSSSDETVVELKDNGDNIPVTWHNRQEYVHLVKQFRANECRQQVMAIRRGLTSVVPARFLSILTWKELEMEVCGRPDIDIDLLSHNTHYRGCSVSDTHIINFWKVLRSFSHVELSQFLRFVWGRSRLPPPAKFTEKMKIDSTSISPSHLPRSHTCFFSLELPKYPDEATMREKLMQAITLCASMENA